MRWEQSISDRVNHDIQLEKMPEPENLSRTELQLVDEVWKDHGAKDHWQLVDWCHTNCREWTPLSKGCAPIGVESIGKALGKSSQVVEKLAREAAELNRLDDIFASA